MLINATKLQVKKAINEGTEELRDDYKEVKDHIQNVTEKMMFLLSEMEKFELQQQNYNNNHNILSEIKSPAPKLFDRCGAVTAFDELNTPRMSIDQYAKSPFTKKKHSTKMQLKFSDFEAEITTEEFEKIPSYIKGRINLTDLQTFLDDVLIRCLNSKYELLYKNRQCLKPSDFNLQLFYKEQINYFEGQKFITVSDISRIMGKNVDKKDEKLIQCLRFLHIIKEARKNSATCYVWIAK